MSPLQDWNDTIYQEVQRLCAGERQECISLTAHKIFAAMNEEMRKKPILQWTDKEVEMHLLRIKASDADRAAMTVKHALVTLGLGYATLYTLDWRYGALAAVEAVCWRAAEQINGKAEKECKDWYAALSKEREIYPRETCTIM